MDIQKFRNIGISAHIDSGKTTLTERILYYCNKIHRIGEVRGKDGVGATMDSMELEKERGITIASAATNVKWKEHNLNIIDTPGHVDFTIEVENALRVLDGAILVLCAVSGVQSQSITVDRQLKRYKVPHIAFINKLDRTGSDPEKVKDQLCEKLDHNAILMQIPIGLEENFEGIIDLISRKARYFVGPKGEQIEETEIPAEYLEKTEEMREEMLDAVSMFDDELAEAFLEGKETEEMIIEAIRQATIAMQITPVFVGSAFKNKGVQSLLDAVIRYLPNPTEIENIAHDKDDNMRDIKLKSDPDLPTVALAFKLENQQYGQLTYLRIYQGTISKGADLINVRTNKKIKVGRLAKMHANNMEDITTATAGDIVALFGVDCALGDTFNSGDINYTMRESFVPKPIISLALNVKDSKDQEKLAKALSRFIKEDPTFKSHVDEETGETIVLGMGELHLNVYIERMRREYDVNLEVCEPRVSYRETLTKAVEFDYIHKKQSGGRGQFARIKGVLTHSGKDDNIFKDKIRGGNIPSQFLPGCEKGFLSAIVKGHLAGFPVVGVKMVLDDGDFHAVDSSQLAFEIATRAAFKENYHKAKPIILEPVMKVSIETPSEFRGNIMAIINQNRGLVLDTVIDNHFTRIDSEMPLSETFGLATQFRSVTQGKADFTMEFNEYKPLPKSVEEEILKEKRTQKK
ncbi:MAG: elongation factor G [Candidatus Cloacimonetes bacterium]|jgi:elongation factor G|nr:elongation factor G [Candidatus Cloacimonadota bacterium]MBT6994981.1 elongation factor G [Candidatus Cloacimonadota bacterium]MBT7469813.1 elongation factor G [Candidatus Cloacimonadota bacterium]